MPIFGEIWPQAAVTRMSGQLAFLLQHCIHSLSYAAGELVSGAVSRSSTLWVEAVNVCSVFMVTMLLGQRNILTRFPEGLRNSKATFHKYRRHSRCQ